MKRKFGEHLMIGFVAILVIATFILVMPTPPSAVAGGYNVFNPGFAIVRGGVADTTLAVTNMDSEDIVLFAMLADTIAAGVIKNITSHITAADDSITVDTVTTAKYIFLMWQNTHDD